MSGSPRAPIAVIGTGYVGLVTAAGFAELGSEVWCVDVDAAKIERLRAGEVPIHEPGLAAVLAAHRERLHFTTELEPALAHARLLFVAVGTPPTASGDADLSAVRAVVDALPAGGEQALVVKSTVPCGTGAAIGRALVQAGKDGYAYVSCPEFLREGSALEDFRHPDRVVVGDDGGWAGDAVAALYAPLGAPLVRTDVHSAEMVKLASNAFLATKISFINEIANVCEDTGATVDEVARGMGLDPRIGPSFLRPGIGYGGSCLTGEETVLVRRRGRTTLLSFDQLWSELERDTGALDAAPAGDRDGTDDAAGAGALEAGAGARLASGLVWTDDLEVLAWEPGAQTPRFLPVMAATRRRHEGEIVELRTKMGRRVRCTPDHPWIVGDGASADMRVALAEHLSTGDWLPLAMGAPSPPSAGHPTAADAEDLAEVEHAAPPTLLPTLAAIEAAGAGCADVIVHPRPAEINALERRGARARAAVLGRHPRGAAQRWGDVKRTGSLRLDEATRLGVALRGATLRTARNGVEVPDAIVADADFWHVVGLYLAEGCCTFDDDRNGARITWSFHPEREEHLVDEVVALWERHGVRARARRTPTARQVHVQSRLLGAWWTGVLGLGRTSYRQRLPDLAWELSRTCKMALLSGLWEGDGSWSLVNGGPSVVLELGTVSRELADGVQRLLGDLGLVASQRIGRTAKSTRDTYWLRLAGADQIERAIGLVPKRDRPGVLASIARQRKRIAPTGYRRCGTGGTAWVRVAETRRERFAGWVYSLEVPGAHTFVTSTGLVTHNCFPKDVSALKQLAGNSGYHFQLLNAVIEVNELQKRRVVAKLQRHLGALTDRTVALLGLAFKPRTDDMRQASSLVLAARLRAEGARVRAYDPVAMPAARAQMPDVAFADSALEALAGADAAVLVTEWDELTALDPAAIAAAMDGDLVVDGRNALDPAAIRGAGLVYAGVGRP